MGSSSGRGRRGEGAGNANCLRLKQEAKTGCRAAEAEVSENAERGEKRGLAKQQQHPETLANPPGSDSRVAASGGDENRPTPTQIVGLVRKAG